MSRPLSLKAPKGAPGMGLWGPLAMVIVVALACQGGRAAPAAAPATPVVAQAEVTPEATPTTTPVEVIPEATPSPSPTPLPAATPEPLVTATRAPGDPVVIPPDESLATPTATPTPTPQARQADTPYAVEIPAIGISADVVPVGRAPDGTMATPENPYAVGWYAAGPRPGSQQNVLLTGHLDWVDALGRVRAGVFWRLRELRPGNEVILEDGQRRYRYLVQESIKLRYDDPQALDLLLFGRGALVTMITCEGPEFDPVARNYLWRRIVVAALQPD